jgi:hypothetical protein
MSLRIDVRRVDRVLFGDCWYEVDWEFVDGKGISSFKLGYWSFKDGPLDIYNRQETAFEFKDEAQNRICGPLRSILAIRERPMREKGDK